MTKINLRVPRSVLLTGDRKEAIKQCRASRENVYWANESGGITIFYMSSETGVVAQKSARAGTFEILDEEGAVVEMEPIVNRPSGAGSRRGRIAEAVVGEPMSDDDAVVSVGDSE